MSKLEMVYSRLRKIEVERDTRDQIMALRGTRPRIFCGAPLHIQHTVQ